MAGACSQTVLNIQQLDHCVMHTYYTNVVPHSSSQQRLFGYFHVEIEMKTHLNASPARVAHKRTLFPHRTSLDDIHSCIVHMHIAHPVAANGIHNDMNYYAMRCAA